MYYTYLNISLNVGSQLWSAHLSMWPHENIFDMACNPHWQLHMQVNSVGVLSLLLLLIYMTLQGCHWLAVSILSQQGISITHILIHTDGLLYSRFS